jgi:hypothetical protein
VITRTAEEAKRNYIEKMGEVLGTQFNALWQEVARLHMKWGEYVELFGSKPTRVEMLNMAAPEFFGIIQGVLWEDVLLHIARLTDMPESKGKKTKKNLTIQNLPGLIEQPEIKSGLRGLIDAALEKTKFCRDWRNRHIAHGDLDLAISIPPAEPLKLASRECVNEALKALVNILNAVDVQYTGSETHFQNPTRVGSVQLLRCLYAGVKKTAAMAGAKAARRLGN